MPDSIRRIWEQQEALFRRLTGQFDDLRRQIGPLGDAAKQIGIGSETMRFLQKEEERRKLLSAIGGDGALTRMAEEAERHRKLLEGATEYTRRLGLSDLNSDARRSMTAAMEAQQAYERMFRRPEFAEIDRLAREAMSANTLTASVFGRHRLGATLEAAMVAMHSPWLNIEHIDRSARAFAEMQAMGRILNERPPFEEALVASLRPNLGDWRDLLTPTPDLFTDPALRSGFYLNRGFDPALTDFTVPAFEESVNAAGLRKVHDVAPDVANAHTEEDGLTRNREAFERDKSGELVWLGISSGVRGGDNCDCRLDHEPCYPRWWPSGWQSESSAGTSDWILPPSGFAHELMKSRWRRTRAASRVARGPGQRCRNCVADDRVRHQPRFARAKRPAAACQQQGGKSGEGSAGKPFSRTFPW